jgi:N-acetylneuraminate synthase
MTSNRRVNLFPEKTYFIADIAANHDGSLDRAVSLIHLAAEAGADAAKFQNFRAETIVSKQGFADLGAKLTHQKTWTKDVVEVYRDAELPIEWTDSLITACKESGIDYFTAPYDLDFIDYFAEKMPFFKVGSGDITWKESLERMAETGVPVLIATGASSIEDVENAVAVFRKSQTPLIVMQCNTNYTGDASNLEYLNLNVLNQYKSLFPECGLGLSDHTPGHLSVLGAVSLGARFIEKHFTDDKNRTGPDHNFSLDPIDWKNMVDETRKLERALGNGFKQVEINEMEAQVVQRRALRYRTNLKSGTELRHSDLMSLRPIPKNGISPMEIGEVIGKVLLTDVTSDQLVTWSDFAI